MFVYCILFLFVIPASVARINEKYDLSRLPYDLLPVQWLVGRYNLESVNGPANYMKPPQVLDFGINPIPHFGSRALNITGHYLDPYDKTRVLGTAYGFMPVKNSTRFDPRIHAALVTTYGNEGMNLIEQGLVRPGQLMTFHLKQFMRRRFVNGDIEGYELDELERKIRVSGDYLTMTVRSLLTHDTGHTVKDDYTTSYRKVYP